MKKSMLSFALTAIFFVAGSANALVIDTFDQYSTNQTASAGGGSWASILYTGNTGIQNGANRLLLARDAHSHTIVGGTTNLLVDATANSFTSSNGSGLDTRIYYGTGLLRFANTNGTSDNAPSLTSIQNSTQLNISASLSDSFYLDIGSVFTPSLLSIELYGNDGSLLGTKSGAQYIAGQNSFLLSSFMDLTSTEALDIDGIGIFFNGNGAGQNLGSVAGLSEVGIAAAVPETETYAMFMAGLGLLGFASRRRKA